MDHMINTTQSCTEAVWQAGLALRQWKGFLALPEVTLDSGLRRLQARVTDSFNFVDHPLVELDGDEVVSFRCDCPDYRAKRELCPHCAALLAGGEPVKAVGVTADSLQEFPGEEAAVTPELTQLSYRFCNSSWDLYPGQDQPRIPLERYIQVFGDNARARSIWRRAGVWGGSCYGMVSSASMLRQADDVTSLRDFSETATIPSELKLADRSKAMDMTLHSFTEGMQILQYAVPISRMTNQWLRDPNCLTSLAQRVDAFYRGEGDPVVMCVYADRAYRGGHAILPYRLEVTGSTEDILHIYDPNWPLRTRYAYLRKDIWGKYTNWRFNMGNGEEYNAATGGQLSMGIYKVYTQAWANRGSGAVDNLISVDMGVAIYDTQGNLLARVSQEGTESVREDIYQIPAVSATLQGGVGQKPMLSLPAGAYVIRAEDASLRELDVEMSGLNLSAHLSTNAREAEICVDDGQSLIAAHIRAEGCRYALEIMNTAGQAHQQVTLLDVTEAEGLRLLQKEGQLYADGISHQAMLYVNNVPAAVAEHIARLSREEESQEELILNNPKKSEEA